MNAFISIAVLLAAALVGGMIAHRLKQPVILGYMLVGILIGPHALGLVADESLVQTMATIGVSLLMFTLGLEISLTQLKQVGRAGLWGGLLQIVFTMAAGTGIAYLLFRSSLQEAILFGMIISLSSTAVGLKILMDRGELSSVHGRIMLGILILQDVSAVVMITAIPLMAGNIDNLPLTLALTLGKTVLFIGAAIVSGLWILPWLMGKIGGIRSRELFLLTVLVLCFGAAVGTQVFGLSAIFGSFIVGLVLRETKFVHQAIAEITPLRDIFASLFFVSLGMLLSPAFVAAHWSEILLLVAAIILAKMIIVYLVIRALKYPSRLGLLSGAGLMQIGEFGFILAQAGVVAGFASQNFYSMVIAGAIITMLLTPLSMSLVSKLITLRKTGTAMIHPAQNNNEISPVCPINGVVICGYGRIGQAVAEGLEQAKIPYMIVDIDPERIAEARAAGRPHVYGDASNVHVLSSLLLCDVRALVIAFPDPIATITTVKAAMEINPKLRIIVRAHRGRDAEELQRLGVVELVSPEYEASFRFLKNIFSIYELQKSERQHLLDKLRDEQKQAPFKAKAKT
ncbi:MAG TPA: cation:proton antiporter [Dehalococcoidales bacterium]|nr:cation:proton antiporter [Dehalococcoidales bacterium]